MVTKAATKKYFQAVGRRKTSTARVRLTPSKSAGFVINDKDIAKYFSTEEYVRVAKESLYDSGVKETFDISVKVFGGGSHSQAEAIRHGISRALVSYDGELRSILKKAGYLKRDPREKERRKFGLKKARKAPQWSKR